MTECNQELYQIIDGKLIFLKPITQIDKCAFKDNTDIVEVEIPQSVTCICEGAFENCVNLAKVSFLGKSSLEKIEAYAFCKSGIQSFTVPKSVIRLDNCCFYACRNMEWFKLQRGSKLSYSGANFQECYKLSAVYIYSLAAWCSIYFSRHSDNPLYAAHNLYVNGKLCEHLVLPASVKSISQNCFTNCFSIKSADFSKVKYFGEACLNGLDNLTDIVLPYVGFNKKNSNINHDYPFCYLFGRFNDNNNSVAVKCFEDRSEINSYNFYFPPTKLNVTILKGEIVLGAFKDCKTIKQIHIGENVKIIREQAFWGCAGLTTVTFEQNCKVKAIEDSAFCKCSALKHIQIPKMVNRLYYQAFKGCSSLKTVTLLGGKLSTIAVSCFSGCKSLQTINIPSSLKQIGAYAFEGCTSLEQVVFESPNGWIYNNQQKIFIPNLNNPRLSANYLKNDLCKEHWLK